MSRTPITGQSGRWFDPSKATSYDEGKRWDGSNHISQATGSQWNHEELYHTASGRWVLHVYSHAVPGMQKSAADKLERMLFG